MSERVSACTLFYLDLFLIFYIKRSIYRNRFCFGQQTHTHTHTHSHSHSHTHICAYSDNDKCTAAMSIALARFGTFLCVHCNNCKRIRNAAKIKSCKHNLISRYSYFLRSALFQRFFFIFVSYGLHRCRSHHNLRLCNGRLYIQYV